MRLSSTRNVFSVYLFAAGLFVYSVALAYDEHGPCTNDCPPEPTVYYELPQEYYEVFLDNFHFNHHDYPDRSCNILSVNSLRPRHSPC